MALDHSELFAAAQKGNLKLVTALLDDGAPVDSTNPAGATALMMAAGRGRTKVVQLLLARGAEVNLQSKSTKTTALHNAASNGATEVIELLLEAGAKLEARNARGETAFFRAWDVATARALAEAGAKTSVKSASGHTPAQAALIVGAAARAKMFKTFENKKAAKR